MLSLVALTVLTCSPNIWEAISDKDKPGPSGVTLRQRVSKEVPRVFTTDFVDATGKVLWKRTDLGSLPSRPPLFSEDGQWVVLEGTATTFEVMIVDPKGELRRAQFSSRLTAAEHALTPRTSCGSDWLQSVRFEGAKVLVVIKQRDLSPLEFQVDRATGAIARR